MVQHWLINHDAKVCAPEAKVGKQCGKNTKKALNKTREVEFPTTILEPSRKGTSLSTICNFSCYKIYSGREGVRHPPLHANIIPKFRVCMLQIRIMLGSKPSKSTSGPRLDKQKGTSSIMDKQKGPFFCERGFFGRLDVSRYMFTL